MTQERKSQYEIFQAIISLDMTAHELGVARLVAANEEREYLHREYWRQQIPALERQFNEQYAKLWSELPGMDNEADGAAAGITRLAMRALARTCGVPTTA